MTGPLGHIPGTTSALVTPASQVHFCVRERRFGRLVPIGTALRSHPYRASLPLRARPLALRMPLPHGMTTRPLAFPT
jgi:hypothetical protein